MQHPLHIHMCIIFVQIFLPSKQRWAGVFWFETFPPKKFQCVEREIMFREWIVSVIYFKRKFWSYQNAAFWQFLNWKKMNFFFETTFFNFESEFLLKKTWKYNLSKCYLTCLCPDSGLKVFKISNFQPTAGYFLTSLCLAVQNKFRDPQGGAGTTVTCFSPLCLHCGGK